MTERWRGANYNLGAAAYWAVDTPKGREFFQFRWQAEEHIAQHGGELVSIKTRRRHKWVDERPT